MLLLLLNFFTFCCLTSPILALELAEDFDIEQLKQLQTPLKALAGSFTEKNYEYISTYIKILSIIDAQDEILDFVENKRKAAKAANVDLRKIARASVLEAILSKKAATKPEECEAADVESLLRDIELFSSPYISTPAKEKLSKVFQACKYLGYTVLGRPDIAFQCFELQSKMFPDQTFDYRHYGLLARFSHRTHQQGFDAMKVAQKAYANMGNVDIVYLDGENLPFEEKKTNNIQVNEDIDVHLLTLPFERPREEEEYGYPDKDVGVFDHFKFCDRNIIAFKLNKARVLFGGMLFSNNNVVIPSENQEYPLQHLSAYDTYAHTMAEDFGDRDVLVLPAVAGENYFHTVVNLIRTLLAYEAGLFCGDGVVLVPSGFTSEGIAGDVYERLQLDDTDVFKTVQSFDSPHVYSGESFVSVDWLDRPTAFDRDDLWHVYSPPRQGLELFRYYFGRHGLAMGGGKSKDESEDTDEKINIIYLARDEAKERGISEEFNEKIESMLKGLAKEHDTTYESFLYRNAFENLEEPNKLFNNKHILIGPHGAGFVNSIFSRHDATLIEFPCFPYVNYFFSNMASSLGLGYKVVPEFHSFHAGNFTRTENQESLDAIKKVVLETIVEYKNGIRPQPIKDAIKPSQVRFNKDKSNSALCDKNDILLDARDLVFKPEPAKPSKPGKEEL